jgi:hypothetical protein
MIIGLAFILLGGFALYFAITGADPIDAFRRALAGAPAPEALKPGLRPSDQPGVPASDLPQDFPSGRRVSPVAPPKNAGTVQLQPGLATAIAAGGRIMSICGPGSVPESEHPHCNAADISGSRRTLMRVQAALVILGRTTGTVHCVIGPDDRWSKGAIRSRENGWKAEPYNGPNSHQGHVHFSGWPSVGGGC